MKHNILKTTVVGLLAALIVVIPAVGFAQDQESDGTAKDSCIRAYGHLIAPGLIKITGTTSEEISERCHLPERFIQRLSKSINLTEEAVGSTTVSTSDGITPIISSLRIDTSRYEATIKWMTDERSDSKVYVSTVSPISREDSSTRMSTRRGMTRDHKVVVANLSASTTYHVIVESRDGDGDLAISEQVSFTTDPSRSSSDSRAPFITNILSIVGTSTIKVTWDTNEPSTSKAYYSTTSPVQVNSPQTPFIEDSALITDHALLISNLSTSTKYYMVTESTDNSGNKRTSGEFTLMTNMGL